MRGFRMLYWFMIGFALSTLLVMCAGCKSTPKPSLEQMIMEGIEQEVEEVGWSPMDEDGYSWSFNSVDGNMIARCSYTYMKVSGVEQWRGVFYYQQTDFEFKPFSAARMDGLAECIEWVNHMTLGGYYL